MVGGNAVWGIDIGQCALKALRCSVDENDNLVAEAFDFIEYPKILSQPEADPDQLIREALEQFLSRNEIKGDTIAMSVSGQAGLARFFKPPPVDAKVLPDIVKYEARQQIPFALEDVIWDYQQMGGVEVDGFTLDAEVGLFAMKREQVFRSLKPFTNAEVEVDIVQLAPLCIYNFVTYDVLGETVGAEEVDPDSPSESIVVLSMGTETTDLVITNGSKLWQRSIPLGGNHFTKQLTKELKLTFAKAEHLKRNAREAEDPKKIFQAMRPVFNDLVTEVQRSITYFQSIDRQAKIGRMVMLGNAVKLPGLRQFLEKNLGHQISRVDEFKRLSGASVVRAPVFHDNLLSFGVCYGLCIQGAEEAKLSTNLLPREFVTARLIRSKKPWAVASVAALLLAFAVNYAFCYHASSLTRDDRTDTVYVDAKGQPVNSDTPGAMAKPVSWADTVSLEQNLTTESNGHMSKDQEQLAKLAHVRAVGEEVVGNADRKLLWLELMKAIDEALPKDPKNPKGLVRPPEERPFVDRPELQIEYIESQFFPDLSKWFNAEAARRYAEEQRAAKKWGKGGAEEAESSAADGAVDNATVDNAGVADAGAPLGGTPAETPMADSGLPADPSIDPMVAPPVGAPAGAPAGPPGLGGQARPAVNGPKGPGWVIEIKGYHFHNSDKSVTEGNAGAVYVRNTLLKALREGKIRLPADPADRDNPEMEDFTFEELGVGYAILVEDNSINHNYKIPNPKAVPATTNGQTGLDGTGSGLGFGMGAARRPEPVDPDIPKEFDAPRYDFRVQFCWREKRLSERLQVRAEKAMAEAARRAEQARLEEQKAAANGEATPGGTPAPPTPTPTAPAAGPTAPVTPVPAAPAPGNPNN